MHLLLRLCFELGNNRFSCLSLVLIGIGPKENTLIIGLFKAEIKQYLLQL